MQINDIIIAVFWILIYLPIHSYFIYPATIKILSKLNIDKSQHNSNETENVSILLSLFNEEKVIENRIENISKLNFEFDKLEVIVGSDASTDNTNLILSKLEKKYDWLKVFYFNERRGKARVLNDLVKHSSNEILVFTDANTVFEKEALQNLCSGFYKKSTGGVSGRLVLLEPEGKIKNANEERRYWTYETMIKKAEGRCGTLIGANGGIFAIRKYLFEKFPDKIPLTDDLYITIIVLSKNKNFIFNDSAVAFEETAPTVKAEFKRKIRFSSTNFQTLVYFGIILKNVGFLTNYCYLSHKIIRWIVPIILIILIPLNLMIYEVSQVYAIIFYVQIIFYSLASIGFILSSLDYRIIFFSLPYFFLITNMAILLGFFRFITGKHTGIWQSTPR